MKGQAALEYLMVLGIAVALSTPFILRAQDSILDLRTGSEIIELRSSLDRIESAADTVNAAGPPARRTFFVEIPEAVNDTGFLVSGPAPDTIVYTLDTPDSAVKLTKNFQINLTGELPQQGRREVSVEALENSVNISVVG